MRSLRLFFSPADNNTSGQLVIASRESQYKILHFHHGGLEKLADILNRWNLFISKPVSIVDGKLPYKHFSVYELVVCINYYYISFLFVTRSKISRIFN